MGWRAGEVDRQSLPYHTAVGVESVRVATAARRFTRGDGDSSSDDEAGVRLQQVLGR